VGGIVTVFDERNHQARNVEVWPDQTNGSPAADLKYRFNWEFPLTISPHDRNKVYVGSQYVHVTTDQGHTWKVISPDLTRNDKSRQGFSGGLTGDDIGVEYAGVVFAIAESPKQAGLIWAGTNDGYVQLTRDGGKTWTNVTANIHEFPEWGTVSNIEASRYDAGTAYLTVDGHQIDNRDPFIFRTKDYGQTWKSIANGIPHSMLSYAHCVREDPVRPGLLFAGTENALYVSFNDGDNWQPLQSNLPHAPVYWLAIQPHFHDLVVATYGRGFWILDNITALENMTAQTTQSDAYLFPPRDTYRFRTATQAEAMPNDPTAGNNPPYGAAIDYLDRVGMANITRHESELLIYATDALQRLSDDELVAYICVARYAGDLNAVRDALTVLAWGNMAKIVARMRLRVPAEAAEEVALEAFEKAAMGAFRGESAGQFHSWLNKIILGVSSDWLRRMYNR